MRHVQPLIKADQPLIRKSNAIYKIFLTEVSHALVGSSLASIALGPVGLDADSLVGILQSFFVLGLSGVDSGTVGVEDVVFRFDRDSLSEFLTVVYSYQQQSPRSQTSKAG